LTEIWYYSVILWRPCIWHQYGKTIVKPFFYHTPKNLTACQQDVFILLVVPVVDRFGTSCYHVVTRLMRPTDSQHFVLTSLVSSARNNLLTSWGQQARSKLLRIACISLFGTTCNKSVTVINLNVTMCMITRTEQPVQTIPDIGLTTTLIVIVAILQDESQTGFTVKLQSYLQLVAQIVHAWYIV
jgi:hypothetical protein